MWNYFHAYGYQKALDTFRHQKPKMNSKKIDWNLEGTNTPTLEIWNQIQTPPPPTSAIDDHNQQFSFDFHPTTSPNFVYCQPLSLA